MGNGLVMSKSKMIVVTGGNGRFGKVLKKYKQKNKNFLFPSKKELNILNEKSIEKYLKRKKPKILLHLAGLSRPMNIHEKNINESIKLNIIGTSNIVNICSKFNIKIIYFSTNYVYPNKKGFYKETDPVQPFNNYAWSKLGGECAVRLYKNSLILRVCMTEYPFIHKSAYTNMYTNFIYHKDLVKILDKIYNKFGVINVGGPGRSVYDFAKKDLPNIKKQKLRKNQKNIMPQFTVMNLKKLKKIIN